MTVQHSADDPRFQAGKCHDCGTAIYYYRFGRAAKMHRCPACRALAKQAQDRAGDLRRRKRKVNNNAFAYHLVYHPGGMDDWGSKPTFDRIELELALGYGKYQRGKEYPFPPGCKFVGGRGGEYWVEIVKERMVLVDKKGKIILDGGK